MNLQPLLKIHYLFAHPTILDGLFVVSHEAQFNCRNRHSLLWRDWGNWLAHDLKRSGVAWSRYVAQFIPILSGLLLDRRRLRSFVVMEEGRLYSLFCLSQPHVALSLPAGETGYLAVPNQAGVLAKTGLFVSLR